jgi:subtilisin family serine protease
MPVGAAADLLVQFVPGTPTATVEAELAAAGVRVVQSFPDGLSGVALLQGVNRGAALASLGQDPEVEYAEPVTSFQAKAQGLAKTPALNPNDPAVGLQWGLNNPGNVDIDAHQAWARTTGSRSTIVAVLDTGIDLSSPEFAGRIWTNPDTSGSDGHPGDVHGWNFVSNDANVQDDDGHGTHVAGILAAAGNNGLGVAGVDWNAQIMPLKVLDSNGSGSNDAMVAAIDYAVQHGARVINASWGGGDYSQAVADAISYAGSQGVVFVTAAGNDGTDNDTTPFYPASYRLPNEISVAAVSESGTLPGFSNYGSRTVDLAAPGMDILSTVLNGGYSYMSGTSMATPYVSGVVALVAGLHPTYSAPQLVQQVLSTTKPLPGLVGKTVTGGIVDAARAVGVNHPGSRGAGAAHLNLQSRAALARISPRPAVLVGPGHHHPGASTHRGLPGRRGQATAASTWAAGVFQSTRRPALQVRPPVAGATPAGMA